MRRVAATKYAGGGEGRVQCFRWVPKIRQLMTGHHTETPEDGVEFI